MQETNNTLYLVDGSSLAYRSFFALLTTGMRNASGIPTWAVYGFFSAIFDLIEKRNPHSLAVCFDLSGPTFRHEEFVEYKANRKEMPDDLSIQWPLIKEGVEALQIPIFELAGWEADDLIGTVAKRAEKKDLKTVILTGDQDAFQLLDDHIQVLMPTKDGLKTYGRQEVFEKLGVWPEQITDYKGLCGDTSDNIPGIKGIGPKTAVTLLGQFGTVEGIYEHIDELKAGSQKTKLIEGKESAFASKRLATIRLDVPVEFEFDCCELNCPDPSKIADIFREMEQRKLLSRLPKILKYFNKGVEPEIDNSLLQVPARSRMKSGVGMAPSISAVESSGPAQHPLMKQLSLLDATTTEFANAVVAAESHSAAAATASSGTVQMKIGMDIPGSGNSDQAEYDPAAPTAIASPVPAAANGAAAATAIAVKPETLTAEVVRSEMEILDLIEELKKVGNFALTLRSSSELALDGELHGMAICYSDSFNYEDGRLWLKSPSTVKRMVYVPTLRAGEGPVSREEVLELFRELLESDEVGKIIFDAKFACNVLSIYNIKMRGVCFDPLLSSYIVNPDENHKLAVQSQAILGRPLQELFSSPSARKNINLDFLPVSQLADSTCVEAKAVHDLTIAYVKAMDDDQRELLWGIDLPTSYVLATLEQNGVKLDLPYFSSLSKELGAEIARLEKEIWELAGHNFNVNSPPQLQKILFEELKLPAKVKTKTGYSTDAAVLESLMDSHPVIPKILEFRHVNKLMSTYVDALPKLISQRDGRLHGEFNQAATSTGRLSSTNPNLQNIPIRTELGRRIRAGFIAADSDSVLISADYSQIELRLLAHMSGDENLIAAFKDGEDIHARTASRIFDKPVAEVTDELRRIGKTLNFALIYQQGAFATGQSLGISTKEAQSFIEKYFTSFPKVRNFMNRIISEAREKGYVQTLWGRRRYFSHLNDRNEGIRKADERAAFNAPLQGSAADLMKLAMIRLEEELKNRKLKTKLILQVHDELVLDVPSSEVEEASTVLQSAMGLGQPLTVPLQVDVGVGKNWKDAK
jgi:DNA polymerase-1